MARFDLRAALVLGVLGLARCGGGGGGGGGGAPPAVVTLARVFPPFGGVLDADSIVVRGTAASPNGVTGVSVGGVAATSGDGFATWTATVPLAVGPNAIGITATDSIGEQSSLPPIDVRREVAVPAQLYGVAFDGATDVVYALGGADPRLFAYDETAKTTTVVSGPTKGAGPTLFEAYPVVLHAAVGKAYVGSNPNGAAVLAVDLATGDRTVVSGAAVGTGPALATVADVELDAANGRLLVTDVGIPALVWVDLASGDRTVVSSDAVGSGPAFEKGSAASTALDLVHGRAFVAQGGTYDSVDLVTGDRTVVSDSGLGIGAGPVVPSQSVAYDLPTDRVLVSTRGVPTEFFSIDPTTGDRVALPSPPVADGAPRCVDVTAMAHDEAGGRLLLADWEGAAVRSYDLAGGAQADVWRPSRGVGPEAPKAGAAALAGDDRMVLVEETRPNALVSVELATGDRSVLDGGGEPISVNVLSDRAALVADLPHGRALFAGQTSTGGGVVGIDLATGVRSLISAGSAAKGPTFPVGALAVETDGTTAWIATNGSAEILSVDLGTGQRATVSSSAKGTGVVFTRTAAIVPDLDDGRLLVGAEKSGVQTGIFAVDLATGDRTSYVTGANIGVPTGLARVPGTDRLVAVTSTVYDVDPALGTATVVSSATVGSGPMLGFPLRLSRIRSDGTIVLYDCGTNAVVAIDPTNGSRLLLSK